MANGGCPTQPRKSNQRLIDVYVKTIETPCYVKLCGRGKNLCLPIASLLISILLF